MKQRIITSAIGLAVLFMVFTLFDTIVINIAVALVCALAVYELLFATGCCKDKTVACLSIIFAAAIPMFSVHWVARYIVHICYLYAIALFICLLRRHATLRIEQIAMSFLFSVIVPFSLATLVYMRDRWGVTIGMFYVLLTLGSAWLTDTGAYFFGCAFGKHKLAPVISPKKTVEGAIGGVLFGGAAMLLVSWLYSLIAAWLGQPITIHYLAIACVMPLFSLASMIGDLSASVIKRQFGVKDYGSIMPGHGGIMDRFDSVLTVAPLVFMIGRLINLASV